MNEDEESRRRASHRRSIWQFHRWQSSSVSGFVQIAQLCAGRRVFAPLNGDAIGTSDGRETPLRSDSRGAARDGRRRAREGAPARRLRRGRRVGRFRLRQRRGPQEGGRPPQIPRVVRARPIRREGPRRAQAGGRGAGVPHPGHPRGAGIRGRPARRRRSPRRLQEARQDDIRHRLQAGDAAEVARDGEGRGPDGGAQGGRGGGHRAEVPRGDQRGRRRVRPAQGARRAGQEAQAREAGDVEDVHDRQGRQVCARAKEGGGGPHQGDAAGRQLAGRRVQAVQPRPRRRRPAQRRMRPPAAQGSPAVPRDLPPDGLRRDADEQLRGERILELRHPDPAPDAPRERRARHLLHEDPGCRQQGPRGLRPARPGDARERRPRFHRPPVQLEAKRGGQEHPSHAHHRGVRAVPSQARAGRFPPRQVLQHRPRVPQRGGGPHAPR